MDRMADNGGCHGGPCGCNKRKQWRTPVAYTSDGDISIEALDELNWKGGMKYGSIPGNSSEALAFGQIPSCEHD